MYAVKKELINYGSRPRLDTDLGIFEGDGVFSTIWLISLEKVVEFS